MQFSKMANCTARATWLMRVTAVVWLTHNRDILRHCYSLRPNAGPFLGRVTVLPKSNVAAAAQVLKSRLEGRFEANFGSLKLKPNFIALVAALTGGRGSLVVAPLSRPRRICRIGVTRQPNWG
jgi:hypothetical protein